MVKVTVHNYRETKEYPKIVAIVGRVLAQQRYVSPIEVFVEMGFLMKSDLERWKRGGVPYLERVIRCNLSRAGRILRILRFHAHDLKLGPSITCYQHRKQPLRFSKSGAHLIEEAYSRHFVVIGKRNPFAEGEVRQESTGLADRKSSFMQHRHKTGLAQAMTPQETGGMRSARPVDSWRTSPSANGFRFPITTKCLE